MGELWDWLSGESAKQASEQHLREKFPAESGLSAETAEAVAAGEVEIDPDSHPDAEFFQDKLNPDDQ